MSARPEAERGAGSGEFTFRIVSAAAPTTAATPMIAFRLAIAHPGRVHFAALRCQIRIEPARRQYLAEEKPRLHDLFGGPSEWARSLNPLDWTQLSVMAPGFTDATEVELAAPCSLDFHAAATKYFTALSPAAGESVAAAHADAPSSRPSDVPLCFLFSGVAFVEDEDGQPRATLIPWDREAYFRLPAALWREALELHYPNQAWLMLRRDIFDQLLAERTRRALPDWESLLAALLARGATETEERRP